MHSGKARLDFVDALRGVAILGVLAIHTGTAIPDLGPALRSLTNFGAIGVKLFFMLSAYTLLSVYRRDGFDTRDFFIRRFFRIAPAFYLAGLAYSILDMTRAEPSLVSAALTLTFTQIWYPPLVYCLVPGGWSIAVEFAFYVLFPLLLVWAVSLTTTAILTVLAFAVASLWALLARWALAGTYSAAVIDDFVYFGFLWNLPAFMLGALLFHLVPRLSGFRLLTGWYGAAWIVAICACLLLAGLGWQPFVSRSIALNLVAVFVLLVALNAPAALVNRPMRLLGEVSYSVYLTHFAVIALLDRALLPFAAGLPGGMRWAILFLACTALSAVMSWGTWTLIEKPGIALGRIVSTRSRSGRPLPPKGKIDPAAG